MSLSLAVLDDLGINLYSSVPAVISEAVANAWDADAEVVEISIGDEEVVVFDTGHGMNLRDINGRYLTVGYKRRSEGRTITKEHQRPVMGRKGIGKLALFAIADEVMVETTDGDERSALVMRTADIRAAIEDEKAYHPEPLDPASIDFDHGTRITLRELKQTTDGRTVGPLIRRLARRFGVIGPGNSFIVKVNGNTVGIDDRGYWPSIQYIWVLGSPADDPRAPCPNLERDGEMDGEVDATSEVTGWIGTVFLPRQLKPEGPALPVLARGKLVHENLLADVPHAGLFTKYIVGEIHAEFVDQDDLVDMATSDRQNLKEGDPRFEALKGYLTDALAEIEARWTEWRRSNAAKRAVSYPAIREWFDGLREDGKKAAEQLFGRIGTLEVDSEEERKALYRYAILAFERLRLSDTLSEIDSLGDEDLTGFLSSAAKLDDLELVLYGEVARGRLEVIRHLEALVDDDEKERVIQQFLADHLWLLHPSWERPTADPVVEKRVGTALGDVVESLTDEERASRLDVYYRSAAGAHIVLELKRYSVTPKLGDLVSQLNMYRSAVSKTLAEHFPGRERELIIYAIVGRGPTDADRDTVRDTLGALGARLMTYDELISDALARYSDFLQQHSRVSDLADLLDRLDSEEPDSDEED